MRYRIAGIDVHKRMLAVVVADVATEGDYEFDRRQFGASPDELRRLADWLIAQNVQEVVMESTAQYWRPSARRSNFVQPLGSTSLNLHRYFKAQGIYATFSYRKHVPLLPKSDSPGGSNSMASLNGVEKRPTCFGNGYAMFSLPRPCFIRILRCLSL
jgi:hypothetical protein